MKLSLLGQLASQLPIFDEMCSLVDRSVLVEHKRFLDDGSEKENSIQFKSKHYYNTQISLPKSFVHP